MAIDVFLIILFAALLHATWNAVVKLGSDTLLSTCLITAVAAAIALPILPFIDAPARSSWPYLIPSAALQVGYFVLVAHTYRLADMSQTYPLMRGVAPLLVAVFSVLVLGETLAHSAWVGIGIISVGILSLAARPAAGQGKGVLLALLNAAIIASYTVIDGLGARQSGTPLAYTLWLFVLTGLMLGCWAALSQGRAFGRYALAHGVLGLVGGFGTLASYGLALWAMTVAPIAMVAALRETSILFAVVIAAVVLKEQLSTRRVFAACAIAIGAIALRWG